MLAILLAAAARFCANTMRGCCPPHTLAIQLSQHHDGLFRAMLADRQRADSILRAHLHPHLLALLADAPPQPLEGSFVDDALRTSYGDKLLQVQLRDGRTAFVYALLEHKSYSDPGTALQVWDYKLRIWRQYAGDSARKLRTLPPSWNPASGISCAT
ncbi:MAG: Rpn family recombination-promoting nuclease/putative transposase [Bryobacterales bacterium]|nr:Rpn family recombination-promoting nuclease/putative transposase [Bryobacterales bacterium]